MPIENHGSDEFFHKPIRFLSLFILVRCRWIDVEYRGGWLEVIVFMNQDVWSLINLRVIQACLVNKGSFTAEDCLKSFFANVILSLNQLVQFGLLLSLSLIHFSHYSPLLHRLRLFRCLLFDFLRNFKWSSFILLLKSLHVYLSSHSQGTKWSLQTIVLRWSSWPFRTPRFLTRCLDEVH